VFNDLPIKSRYWNVTKQWTKIYDALVRHSCPFDHPAAEDELREAIGTYRYQSKSGKMNARQRNLNACWQALVARRKTDPVSELTQPLPEL